MYRVKLSVDVNCINQTPLRSGKWGNYQFEINGEGKEYDFWVIYSKGISKEEECLVAPENTIFISGEPESIYHYSHGFVNQCGKAILCRNDIKHPNIVHNQPAQMWFIGRIKDENGIHFKTGYDDYKNKDEYNKEKLISVISSNKAFTKGHQRRIDFVNKLKEHYGDKMDIFGRGYNAFDDKWDVVSPYKYHIVIENSCYADYWTEKLADCFIGGAFPIYYGCPNVEKYFDSESMIKIDINDFDASVAAIDKAIADDLYNKRQGKIIEAKNKVLDEYNLFAMLATEMDKMNPGAKKKLCRFKPDIKFFDLKKVKTMIIDRLLCKMMKKSINK